MQKKTIQIDHFKPYYLSKSETGETTEKPYNLGYLFKLVSIKQRSTTARRIYGDIFRFHICRFDNKLSIWEIQVLRLREKILPGQADIDGEYELIELEDGMYPAESSTILYDERHNILYMQRNIYGLSIKCLESYLELLSPNNTSVLLKPVRRGNKIDRIKPTNLFRSVILVADTDAMGTLSRKENSLLKTLNSFEKYQGRIVKIDIGFGRDRKGLLKQDATADLVRQAYEFSGTQKLIVKTSDPEDIAFETIDLIDDREKYVLKLEYSRERPITHGRIYYECLATYKHDLGIE